MKDRIKTIRTHEGKTQQEFADKLGLSRNFVSLLESGDRQPSDRTLDDICRLYNVNRQWLDTGEGDMHIQLQRVDEISDFFKRVLNADMSDEGEASLQAFITALARLSPEQLTSAAKLIDTFIENYTDAKKEGQE